MTRSRIALIAATAIAALYGAGFYYEQNLAGPHCCGLTWPTPDPAQTERLMAKDDPKGAAPIVQRSTAVAVLAARPMESGAWLRLAYADRLQHGQLTDEGRHALEMSYLILPFAGPQAPWRVSFAFDNWTALAPQARKDVVAEIGIIKTDWRILAAARTMIAKIQNPSGKLAASLLLAS
jgi:hypothetical protein